MKMFIVQSIVGKRGHLQTKNLEYHVKWKGFAETQNTWEPEANLKYVGKLIDQFNSKRKRGRPKLQTRQKIIPKKKEIRKINQKMKRQPLISKKDTAQGSKKDENKEDQDNNSSSNSESQPGQDEGSIAKPIERNEKQLEEYQKIEQFYKIEGINRKGNDLYFLVNDNGVQKWLPRKNVVEKNSIHLCLFYERHIQINQSFC